MLVFIFELMLTLLVAAEGVAAALHYFDLAGSDAHAKTSKPRAYLEAVISNLMATAATIFLTPWAFNAHKRREFNPTAGPPICLVSSSFWGWGAGMFGLYRNLKARGAQNVYLLHLPFSRGAIDRMADALTQELEKLSGQIGGHKPYLIAHGIAGIAARMSMAQHPNQLTRGNITIAAPHHGTKLAVFMPGQLGFQLKPGSPLLKSLSPDANGIMLNIYSPTDTQIIPSHSALFGQQVYSLPACGHLSVLWSASLADQIVSEIATANQSPG